jgi:hypothetical protein
MRSRAGLLVLKTAMLFRVSADPANLVVTLRDLERAIEYVERCQQRAEKFLNDEVTRDRHEVHRLRILEILRRAGGRLLWSRALMNSHLTAREFNEAVLTLQQTEQVLIEPGPAKQRGLVLATHSTVSNGVVR